jgi:glycosyltransferase involved in cell wall biosynthesis
MYQVSLLVPVYGVEKYIERCARSLFEQTYENLEYIFVDDCSPDQSIEILKRVMEDYPARKEHVRIIRHEKNRGLAAARNTALDNAHGLFISHVDSDDYLDCNAVQLLVDKQVETGADIVSGNYYIIRSNKVTKVYEPPYENQHEMMLATFAIRMGNRHIWRRLINARLHREYGIRPIEGVNFMEDWQQIAILVYYANKVARIDEHIYYYNRTNDGSYLSIFCHNIELWRQSVESALFVENFFVDKEQEYYNLAHRLALNVLKTRMSLAARFREMQYFEELKRIIMSEYDDCFDTIGWDNPIVRIFMCNYSLNGLYRRFYALIRGN